MEKWKRTLAVRFFFQATSFLNHKIRVHEKDFQRKDFLGRGEATEKACDTQKVDCTAKEVCHDDVALLNSRRDNFGKMETYPCGAFLFCYTNKNNKRQGKIMAKKRFIKVYKHNVFDVQEILVDTQTGVNYFFYANGTAGGLTPLLDKDGKVVVTPVEEQAKEE